MGPQIEIPNKTCKPSVVESYNLASYVKPRQLNLWICPSIELSCCSVYDQFEMFQQWNKEAKQRMQEYFKGIRQKIDDVTKKTKLVMKQDIEDMIKKIKADRKVKRIARQRLSYVKHKKIIKNLEIAYKIQPSNANFMTKVRSAFYCTICDFNNHHYFKLQTKVFQMGYGSCAALAEGTINLAYVLNVRIAPVLIQFAKVLRLFEQNPGAELGIKHFRQVVRATEQCAKGFTSSKGGNVGKMCKKYCKFFGINNTSAVQEGFQVFFNDVINMYQKFFKHIDLNEEEEESKQRILSTLFQKTGKNLSRRVLEEAPMSEVFSKEDFYKIKDAYKETPVHPEYNEHTIRYDYDRHSGYVNFARNSMYYYDAGVDYEQGVPTELFKLGSSKIIRLEEFATDVKVNGASFTKHAETTNINGTMKDLIIHLKLKSKYKIHYEKLDPTALDQINDINNNDIMNFHRDFFLKFNDYTQELKTIEIITKEQIKKKQEGQLQAQQKIQDQAQQAQGSTQVQPVSNEQSQAQPQTNNQTQPQPQTQAQSNSQGQQQQQTQPST